MIEKETLSTIYRLIKENKILFDFDAEKDILKQGYNWSKEFIIDCLKKGKKYKGSELYPDMPERKKRYYCIHKHSTLSSNLILICFLIHENLLIIHMLPLNRSSKEGRIYYSTLPLDRSTNSAVPPNI
jgi:hypothetical protein